MSSDCLRVNCLLLSSYGYGAPASSSYTAPSTGYAAPAAYSARSTFGEDVEEVSRGGEVGGRQSIGPD